MIRVCVRCQRRIYRNAQGRWATTYCSDLQRTSTDCPAVQVGGHQTREEAWAT